MALNFPCNSIWQHLFTLISQQEVSDIHLSPGLPPIGRAKLSLKDLMEEKLTAEELATAVQNYFLTPLQYEKLQSTGAVDFRCSFEGISFRGNVFSTYLGYAMALRKIPRQAFPLDIYAAKEVLWQLAQLPRGLVLICGATGTGKSSTLAALLEKINGQLRKHIITLEDPIEYLFTSQASLIQQRELGKDFDSFPQGIKMALRQDPDILMVGEIRDQITMASVLEAAETGHLVLGTLHAGTTVEAIARIIAFFDHGEGYARRQQLAQVLGGVIAQQLVLHKNKINCVMEVLLPTTGVKNLIRQNKDEQIMNQIQLHSKEGMITMEQALRNLQRS